MATISNSTNAVVTHTQIWEIPPGAEVDRTVIPRGMTQYQGAASVAALGAGDVLRLRVQFVLPTNFFYLLKTATLRFISDGVTESWEANGQAIWNDAEIGFDTVSGMSSVLTYDYSTGVPAARVYQLIEPVPQIFLSGPAGSLFIMETSDITPTSLAGDVFWGVQMYQFDVEQMSNYAVHTQFPTR